MYFSLTICVLLSINFAWSQQQSLNGFPQPKAIRDNSGYFRQETFYPGSAGNFLSQPQSVLIQRPVEAPTVNDNSIPVPVSIPIRQQSSFVNIPAQPIAPTGQQLVEPAIVRSNQNRQKPVALPVTPVHTTTARIFTTTEPATFEEQEEQAKSAYYNFGTSVRDTINDHEHIRQEVREGLGLKGLYSYSDGFFRRTVHYEADEGGYRVTKEEIQPIGNGEGPKFNPKGQAAVKSTLAGDYSITVDDFRLNKKQEEALDKRV